MSIGFLEYIERLELLGFFAGYPVIYLLILVLSNQKFIYSPLLARLPKYLPLSYALTGTLYLGFFLKNLYPDYSFQNIGDNFLFPFLKTWGLCSVIFWIPIFQKKLFTLIHSLVFFFLLIQDIWSYASSSEYPLLRNDMKLYTDSLLLNAGSFLLILIAASTINYLKTKIIVAL